MDHRPDAVRSRSYRTLVHPTSRAVTALEAQSVATPVAAPANTAKILIASFIIAPSRVNPLGVTSPPGTGRALARFRQRTVDERDCDRSLTDSRRYPFDVAAPNVANGKHTGTRRFEQVR